MARDFTKNVSNFIGLGVNKLAPLINGASKISFHAIVTYDSLDTAADNYNRVVNCLLNGNAAAFTAGTSITTPKLRIGGRSVSTDSFQAVNGTTTLVTGTEYSIGGVLDFSGDAIRVYLNGVQEASTAVTFGNATFTNATPTGQDSIGWAEGMSTTQQVDGRISEVAVWKGDITTAGFERLNARFSADRISPELLVAYFKLLGVSSPERDIRGGLSGTITGTVAGASHPRMIYPHRRALRGVSVSSGVIETTASSAGTGTATGIGSSPILGTASSTGAGTATGIGSSPTLGTAASVGTGTATGIGEDASGFIGQASGASTAAGISAATILGTAASAGTGTATGISTSTISGIANSAGAGMAAGIGSSPTLGTTASAGASTATGIGSSPTLGMAASVGTGTATGTGESIFSGSVGEAIGIGTATGIGSSLNLSTANSVGTSVANGVGANAVADIPTLGVKQIWNIKSKAVSYTIVKQGTIWYVPARRTNKLTSEAA